MLNSEKLKKLCSKGKVNIEQLAGQIVRGGLDKKKASSAIRNWQRGLMKPIPRREDIRKLAGALGVNENDLAEWSSSHRYAPVAPRKARLVTELIVGRPVQDALDVLKFTRKRTASFVDKILKSAIADADEQQADVDSLYISEARVDGAGVRLGTKRWIAKDRGRAHSIRKEASHIYVTITQE